MPGEEVLAVFLRILRRSFIRGWKRKALAVVMVAAGTSLAAAMLNVSLDVGDKVGRELRSYGANILVTPEAAAVPLEIEGVDFNPLEGTGHLSEADLPRLKMIFWRNNIVDFAPYLKAGAAALDGSRVTVIGTWFEKTLVVPTGETVVTGVKPLKKWWRVDGAWPEDTAATGTALVGEDMARQLSLKPGDSLTLTFTPAGSPRNIMVSGIIAAGGEEDRQIFVPLDWLQAATQQPDKVSQIEVSALTMPKNELGRRVEEQGVDSLSREEFEVWYCSPYVDSVAYQIEEAIPGARARPIRQIAEAEGIILGKVQLLMTLLALAAVAGSALGISSLTGAAALERSREIGLIKAMGGHDVSIAWLFLAEAAVIGVVGGALGYGVGLAMARFIATSVFGTGLELKMLVIPVSLAIAVGLSLLGSLGTVRLISRLRPAAILVGRQS
ncbi:MAG: ABC transporter permease [Chloroflexota bacterium]